jgi:hypothetical protein
VLEGRFPGCGVPRTVARDVRESVALEGAPHRRSATGLPGTGPPGEGVRAAILERSDNRGNQRTDRPPLDLVHHPSFASQQSSPTGPVGLVTVPVEVPGYRQERETGTLRSYRARELAHTPAFAATWRTLVVALYDSASSTSNWAAHRSIGSSLVSRTPADVQTDLRRRRRRRESRRSAAG